MEKKKTDRTGEKWELRFSCEFWRSLLTWANSGEQKNKQYCRVGLGFLQTSLSEEYSRRERQLTGPDLETQHVFITLFGDAFQLIWSGLSEDLLSCFADPICDEPWSSFVSISSCKHNLFVWFYWNSTEPIFKEGVVKLNWSLRVCLSCGFIVSACQHTQSWWSIPSYTSFYWMKGQTSKGERLYIFLSPVTSQCDSSSHCYESSA